MSTIKSSAEDLTLNADGSGNDIILQSNGSQVGLLTAEGVFTATSFAGSGAALTGISAGTALTGSTNNTIPTVTGANAISGEANLTFDGTDLTLGTGDIVFGTAGKGICLGVTSNTDSNTLDDYEEGTWTAGFTGGTVTPLSTVGHYIRVGRLCHISYYGGGMTISGASSSAVITGLPFTTNDTSKSYSVGTSVHGNAMNEIDGYHMDIDGTSLRFVVVGDTGYRGWLDGSSKYVMITGTYIIKEGS